MIALDLNVLSYAMRSDLPQHQLVFEWLESVRTDRQPVALFPPVLVGLLRIARNPRVFVNPGAFGAWRAQVWRKPHRGA
jgi:predicted nucleic acid-binding protein